jgi:hypothetical protein
MPGARVAADSFDTSLAHRLEHGPVQSPEPKGKPMTDVKSIFASRTVWTNIVGLASVGLALVGVDTGDIDADRFAEAAAQLVAAASFIGSTVFRIAASRRLVG